MEVRCGEPLTRLRRIRGRRGWLCRRLAFARERGVFGRGTSAQQEDRRAEGSASPASTPSSSSRFVSACAVEILTLGGYDQDPAHDEDQSDQKEGLRADLSFVEDEPQCEEEPWRHLPGQLVTPR